MDPYKVLGISRDATDEQVKAAYRELARKYHPDKYVNNPLADLAQEKMKQINEAYDLILKERGGAKNSTYQAGGSYQSYGGSQGTSASSAVYMQIRQLISLGNLQYAEMMLNRITDRTAEWYFLRGSIDFKRGWFDQARRNFETASQMDPGNGEYRQAVNQMQNQNVSYQSYGSPQMCACTPCDLCTSLMCADCCCDCFGGGFC